MNKKDIPYIHIHINSTFNNTIITVTDIYGNVLGWKSSGSSGYKGSRKSTPYAAQESSRKLCEKMISNYKIKKAKVFIKGLGSGKESVIRSFNSLGIKILEIKEITGIPHNGCRPPKKRRV